MAELGSAAKGLDHDAAKNRLREYGPNELVERGGRGVWRIVVSQISSVLILLLIAAALVSAALGDWPDAAAIMTIVVLNAALGARQEYGAEQAMAALKKLSAPRVKLRRSGHVIEAEAADVVPGDIMLIDAGSAITADARLVETANLRVDQATLTGESEPVEKGASESCAQDSDLAERRNMVFRGTAAVHGRAEAVVTETGMRTELGRIAELIQTVAAERTPLQKRLDHLGRLLVTAAIVIVAVVFALGALRGEPLDLMFLTAVSLAVAAAPEGLPAVVTIALALGARRMLRRNALIRRLPAVETLGSVTFICSDKTGTLTENQMRATRVETLAGSADLGDASRETPAAARLTLAAAALANDATLEHDTDGRRRTTGDPTETALVEAAADVGVDKAELEERSPRTAEVPFDSNRKRMTTLHRIDETDDLWAPLLQGRGSCQASFTKGALDSVLAACDLAWTSDGASSLTDDIRESIRRTHDSMAASGIRVLATAARAWDDKGRLSPEQLEQGLTYLGMIGLMDPPRPEAREAVERCKEAGIRTVMITGDHHATAASIAKSLGVGEGGQLIVGRDLNALSDSQLEAQAEEIGVYARVSPEHKLRIVEALQRRGQVVAMTGDGVNDAPALKKADIGVAMGVVGSDVSKEAADVVLRDDTSRQSWPPSKRAG